MGLDLEEGESIDMSVVGFDVEDRDMVSCLSDFQCR